MVRVLTKFRAELMVALSSVLLNLTTINQLWVPTQDWYLEWARNVNLGRTMYSDFFVPFPPLYVELYRTFSVFPDPLLASRIANLIIYVAMTLGLFRIIRLYTNEWVAVVFGVGLASAIAIGPTNTIAGYWEFAVALCSWSIYLFLSSKKAVGLFVSGVLIALASLTKQNFVAVVAVIFLVEGIRYFRGSALRVYSLFGIASVYTCFTIWLLLQGSFADFVSSMLAGGGKSLTLTSLRTSLLNDLRDPLSFVTVFVFLIVSIFIAAKPFRQKLSVLETAIFASLLGAFFWAAPIQSLTSARAAAIGFVGSALFCGIILWANRNPWSHIDENSSRIARSGLSGRILALTMLFVPPTLVFASWFVSNSNDHVFERIWVRIESNLQMFSDTYAGLQYVLWVGISAVVLIQLTALGANRKLVQSRFDLQQFDPLRDGRFVLSNEEATVFLGLFASLLLNAFTGAASLVSNLVLAAFAIGWLYSRLARRLADSLASVFGIFATLSIVVAAPLIVVHTYQWFGWDEVKTPNVASELEVFRNFSLTQTEANFFAAVSDALDQVTEALPADSTIAVFPNQPIFYSLTTLEPVYLKCPISWIDICPDSSVREDRELISEGIPDVVVYYALPESTQNELDRFYRAGDKSEIHNILLTLLASKNYSLNERIPVPVSDGAEVLIFVRNLQ